MGSIIILDFKGNTLSSVFQYGQMDWELFYSCLKTIISSTGDWAIFHYDSDEDAPRGKKGAICEPDRSVYPDPGTYVLLTPDGDPIAVDLVLEVARTRRPTVSNTQTGADAYHARVRRRDPCCLISGLRVSGGDFTRFKTTHIFPRSQSVEWNEKGYPGIITDTAPSSQVGGASKIDSIQNVFLLRSDIRDAWNNYDFAVNPDRGHVVIPFVDTYEDIAGKVLKLDHIEDLNHRPLDELFRDHFRQCVLKNMKGIGSTDWDYEDPLDDGSLNLSHEDWGTLGGAHVESAQRERLYDG